jgi:hypothetical protein
MALVHISYGMHVQDYNQLSRISDKTFLLWSHDRWLAINDPTEYCKFRENYGLNLDGTSSHILMNVCRRLLAIFSDFWQDVFALVLDRWLTINATKEYSEWRENDGLNLDRTSTHILMNVCRRVLPIISDFWQDVFAVVGGWLAVNNPSKYSELREKYGLNLDRTITMV